jgi:nitrogen fixation protein NifU and related proteins
VSAVQYSDVIRQRFRNPRFRGRLPTANASYEDVNPLCGDRIGIECRMDAGRLAEARHHGDCCAICGASADLLIEMGLGRTAEELGRLGAADILERLEADIRPTRLKCVTLPLTVLQGALAGKEVAR